MPSHSYLCEPSPGQSSQTKLMLSVFFILSAIGGNLALRPYGNLNQQKVRTFDNEVNGLPLFGAGSIYGNFYHRPTSTAVFSPLPISTHPRRSAQQRTMDLYCLQQQLKQRLHPIDQFPFCQQLYDEITRSGGETGGQRLDTTQGNMHSATQQKPKMMRNAVAIPDELTSKGGYYAVKRVPNYDFIRFGRSADKKAAGNTYDYIRFGKRNNPDRK